MKDSVLIINDARGPLIVEEDLEDALVSGRWGGAPLWMWSHLNRSKRTIRCYMRPISSLRRISPGRRRESRERLIQIAADNLKAFWPEALSMW